MSFSRIKQDFNEASCEGCEGLNKGSWHMCAHGLVVRLFASFTSFLLLLVLFCNTTHAQSAADRSPSTQATVSGGSAVDLQLSRVYIRVGKTGLGHEHGVEGRLVSGNIQLGATQNAGELVFDMPTFTADTHTARTHVGLKGETDAATQQKVNSNMRGPDVLDVAKYPQAIFRIRSAKLRTATTPDKAPIYDLDGQFTLHGVARPLRVAAIVTSAEGRTGLRGHFDILQSEYGITPYSAALGAVGVADKLEIMGDLWMASAPGVQR
jgi:polyisoprenoid-binding protein YceI